MKNLVQIPEGWKRCKIGDLIKSGDIVDVQDGNHGNSHPKSSDFVNEGERIPFIMANNIHDGHLDLKSCKFISKMQANVLRIGFSHSGDVLLSHKGTVGQVSIVPNSSYEYVMLTPQVTYYRVNPKKIYNEYLAQYFRSPDFQIFLKNASAQSTRAYIGITNQKEIDITLPTYPEQQKIATILSTVDEEIEKVDQIVTKTQQLKKGMMQELLTKGIGHTKFRKSRIGQVPDEWKVTTVGELCSVKGGKRLPKGKLLVNEKTSYPYIRVTDFKEKTVDMANIKYLSPEIYETIKRYVISSNDIYISIAGTIGLVGSIPEQLEGANLTENAAKIAIIKNQIDKEFLLHFLSSDTGQKQINEKTVKTTQPKLALSRIEKIEIPLPSKEEQQRIAEILSDLDGKIGHYRSLRSSLFLLKEGLMQDLLSGNKRISI